MSSSLAARHCRKALCLQRQHDNALEAYMADSRAAPASHCTAFLTKTSTTPRMAGKLTVERGTGVSACCFRRGSLGTSSCVGQTHLNTRSSQWCRWAAGQTQRGSSAGCCTRVLLGLDLDGLTLGQGPCSGCSPKDEVQPVVQVGRHKGALQRSSVLQQHPNGPRHRRLDVRQGCSPKDEVQPVVQVGRHKGALQCSSVLQQKLPWSCCPGRQRHIAYGLPTLALAQRKALVVLQEPAAERSHQPTLCSLLGHAEQQVF